MKILFILFVLFSLLSSCSAEQSVVSPVDRTNNDSKIEKAGASGINDAPAFLLLSEDVLYSRSKYFF